MKVSDFQQLVKNVNEHEIKAPILCYGSTGIGKSWSVKELAKVMGIGYIDLRLATQEVTDLIGIPRTVKDEGKEPKTVWTKPSWFPEIGTKGVLVLEEVNRAPEDVRQAIFQLLTEWKLHTHEMPTTWSIVSLVNPDNGSYHVNQLDPAFKRRFIQLVLDTPDVTDWSIWAKKNKLSDDIVKFVGQFPKLLSKTENIDIQAEPTPAGYHMLSNLLEDNVIPSSILLEVATGILGVEAGTTFVTSLKRDFEKPISANDILVGYEKTETLHKKYLKEKRQDLLYVTMVDIIATCETSKLTKKQVENINKYLNNSEAETVTTIILRLRDNDKILEMLSQCEELVEKVKQIKKEVDSV